MIEDLRRRNFTINAMTYNDEEGLINPFNGLKDIKHKKIQCIGSAKDRFYFPQNNPYHDYDVYCYSIHAIEKCTSDDLIVRLAVFFHYIGKPHSYQNRDDNIRHFKGHGRVSADITNNIMKRLRFDNETRNNVIELVYYHDATFEVGKKYVKRWFKKIGEEQFRRLLEVRKADIREQKKYFDRLRIDKINDMEKILDKVLQADECFSLKDLAVNGNGLIDVGYKERF